MKTILIVDDDVCIGDMLQEVLVKEGYQTARAYSGTEALLYLSGNRPDLILLDLMLPGLSGEELLPLIEGIPVIVVSARSETADKVSYGILAVDPGRGPAHHYRFSDHKDLPDEKICPGDLRGVLKICLMKKSAQEISEAFLDRLTEDTNTLIDISSRDRHMRELAREINIQLNKLKEERHRFQQGDRELKDAVTNISHDIRTPLTAVCGYLDLLDREAKSEDAARYLKIIRSRTEILRQLTEELFRYSVFTSAADGTPAETVILNRLLEESISAFYALLRQREITPRITLPEEKVRRTLSRSACSRLFGNLISNALKYSDGDLEITLKDTGEIIFSNHASRLDEIQVGRLFDRFYTVETASSRSNGLGLSIARVLTEQMGGTISAGYEDGVLQICILFPEK